MSFPTLPFWSNRDPGDAVGRIDRALDNRVQRLSAGLSISSEFSTIQGALVISQGNGKYLRIRHVAGASATIPPSIVDGCLEFLNGCSSNRGELGQLLADLAGVQAIVVEDLKRQAGKYVDRVLAVSVCDPGFWQSDFDGRLSYSPMCDSTRLAEQCGVSVIDAFPARDLAVNGRGRSLEALPIWILFSDRNAKVASQTRGVITFGERTTSYTIPASDGLDANIPEIAVSETVGFHFLEQLVFPDSRQDTKQIDFASLFVDSKTGLTPIPQLKLDWQNVLENALAQHAPSGLAETPRFESLSQSQYRELSLELTRVGAAYLEHPDHLLSHVVSTGIHWITELIANAPAGSLRQGVDRLFVSCPDHFELNVIRQLEHQLPETSIVDTQEFGISHVEFQPAVAAILGLFHIDQMPANIPWLTGADSQRILGRLTPGRPASWRQLIRTMADFQPAPMKLKDAI